jgi:hypothetical protein
MKQKTYLGDSVYVTHDGYQYWLTTENGSGPSNSIAMEPMVVDAFFKYIERTVDVKIKVTKELAAEEGEE